MVVVRFIAKQMRSQCFQEILCLGRVNNTCSLPRRHLQSSHVCILSSVTSGFTIRKTESVDFRLRRIPYPQPMMFLCPLMYQTFSTKDPSGQSDVLSELIYDQMSENTLDILTEFFENLEELVEVAEDFDVTYSLLNIGCNKPMKDVMKDSWDKYGEVDFTPRDRQRPLIKELVLKWVVSV
ncbi:uncharacterized protein [Ptychodera flava]|uniref:uncharacterized protein isoform X2 n=1 Tax=Ptychodera flava TaxID=63121 RepID=UPI003969E485